MTFFCYCDRSNEWRWRLMAGGHIIADSGEGYSRKDSLKRAVERLQRLAGAAGSGVMVLAGPCGPS